MKILCLHGFGTTPEVMKRQMSALTKHFDRSWDFHFLAGKVESPAAPGIAEAFPGPYLCWSLDFGPIANRAALDLIHETIQREGPFDGVFGFSQGASVMAAYLLEQAALHPDTPLPVRFGIFCSPPPILATDPAYIQSVYGALSAEDLCRLRSAQETQVAQLPDPVRTPTLMFVKTLAAMAPVHGQPLTYFFDRPASEIPCVLDPDLYKVRLSIPTLHVCGENDPPSLQQTFMLCESFCDPKWRRSFKHSSTHNLPRVPAEAKEMVAIMEWVISRSQQSRL
ncbi:serine hydrolase FSH [Aspergillus varians]